MECILHNNHIINTLLLNLLLIECLTKAALKCVVCILNKLRTYKSSDVTNPQLMKTQTLDVLFCT